MNKRLVWNFEINMDSTLEPGKLKPQPKEPLRWERRYFWPESTTITLARSIEEWLAFSDCSLKQRADHYFLVQDEVLNIKQRRGDLLYKPCLQIQNHCYGFDKKINVSEAPVDTPLPGSTFSPAVLLGRLKNEHAIFVEKTAFVYKLPTEPTIKLELARINLGESSYYTACIEGHSLRHVSFIAESLLNAYVSCDYVSFLKQNRPK